jgi:hypothetical protein
LCIAGVERIEQTDGAETTKEQAFHARTSWQEGGRLRSFHRMPGAQT